uniref:Reelin domain-containing protein n=1 Tax=Lepeophtheirus salmonis TaxID=72036 RepID=A0A0K2V6Q0_LEPSM
MTTRLFITLLFLHLLKFTTPYPNGVPSCSLSHPIGHSLLDYSSQSYSNPKGLPVSFRVVDNLKEEGSFRLFMEGDFIKGYLIRVTENNHDEENIFMNLLNVKNDILTSILAALGASSSTSGDDSKSNPWSVPKGFPPGLEWTTIKDGCIHHNSNFSRGREPEERTYMEFEYKSASKSPVFEAIVVENFNTWWHNIQISKNAEGVYTTQVVVNT